MCIAPEPSGDPEGVCRGSSSFRNRWISSLFLLRGRVVPTPSKVSRARLNCGQWQLLVNWEGRTAADATWEPIAEFKERYPEF
jgi:hypothetical protein